MTLPSERQRPCRLMDTNGTLFLLASVAKPRAQTVTTVIFCIRQITSFSNDLDQCIYLTWLNTRINNHSFFDMPKHMTRFAMRLVAPSDECGYRAQQTVAIRYCAHLTFAGLIG